MTDLNSWYRGVVFGICISILLHIFGDWMRNNKIKSKKVERKND